MTSYTDLVLAGFPRSAAWDYGGFPYGLEPLVLPPTGQSTDAGTTDAPDDATIDRYGEPCRHLLEFAGEGPPGQELSKCPTAEDLFWFRWVTGHQATFILWTLLADLMGEAMTRAQSLDEVREPMVEYVRACAAMLLYTGSCSPTVYEQVIRPSMQRQHPAFSGGWAPDFHPVRLLFRSQAPLFTEGEGSEELVEALRLHQAVHDGIAAKLVPDGKSLLQHSWMLRRQDPRVQGMLYDNYFLTVRAPVARPAVLGQLVRRLAAVLHDVAANTLSPIMWRDPRQPPEALERLDVLTLERDFAEIGFRAATFAAGLPAWYVGDQLARVGVPISDSR